MTYFFGKSILRSRCQKSILVSLLTSILAASAAGILMGEGEGEWREVGVRWGRGGYFFKQTLFHFGLTIVPIQNTGLINSKYNNTLSGKYNNTLYGTINTNRLNIFTLMLHNI